jgi:dihydropteroate synthase
VSLDEELSRVVPAIEALRARFDVPISVDTWRAQVLRQAIAAGASIGNDISGFADPDYLTVAAAGGASVVATHIRLQPRVPDPDPAYGDLGAEVRCFLADRARLALAAGVPAGRIILDAGLDLGKTPPMSLELLHRSEELVELGFPVLLSASNKRFLFELLETTRYDIAAGTDAAHTIGVAKGCRVLRAHDARSARRLADLMALVLAARREV